VPTAHDDWRPRANPWAIAMIVTMATFMEVLDTSIANVSLPHIAGSLSAGQDESTWVLTSYLIANAIVLPLSGWLANLVGRKRFYMTCVALFTVSSCLCGLAPNLPALIVFRVLQGVGGGGLQPSEQAILADTFPPERRGMAFAIYGMAVVLAPAIGPTLGGYITDNFNWRWIFFINIPVGLTSLVLTSRVLEDPPWARPGTVRARQIDYVGLSLIVLGLGSLQYVLDKGQREDWFSSHVIVAFAVVAGLCIVGAVLWEWSHPRPVVDVKLFRTKNFGLAFGMMLMLGALLFGTTVLLPLFLQTLLGWTAQQAGEALSAGGVLVIVMLPIVGKLLSKVDARWLIAFGFCVIALSLFHMAGLTLEIDFRTAMMYRIYQAAGLAFLFIPITTIAYVGVPREKNNQVSSLVNLARNVGGSVGISLATTFIARRSQFHQDRLVAHVQPFDPDVAARLSRMTGYFAQQGGGPREASRRALAALSGALGRQASAMAYVDTMYALAVAAAVLIPLAFALERSRPGAQAMAH
jgi:MFS transporter, DHA2 family, multidrug resistance protein